MIDLVGKKFGRLTVVGFDRLQNHKTYWKCICDCGLSVIAAGNSLRSGNTSSCGCLRRETARQSGKRNTTHGESHNGRTRLYTIWLSMRRRCGYEKHEAYALYGGRGITVCDEWQSYPEFRKWAYSNGYYDQPDDLRRGEKLSIDRINPSKGYSPENCRWISLSENIARANKNHTTRKLIRGEGSQEREPAATHSGRARTAISHHEAGTPGNG